MTIIQCKFCKGTQKVDLPTHHLYGGLSEFDVCEFNCPICLPWECGFPGLLARGKWVVSPSQPKQPAVFHGYVHA